ncbi:MAG: flagellar hook assembly protein FlgD [Candidatus Kapaibacterium sp.]|jgi:flagellar basal-body rod modification protein FlgD
MSEAVSAATKQLFEQYAAQPTSKTANKDLGKNEFLKLLTMQMKYQDPTSPMDNKQMATQLAQFSSLEQLQNINTSLEKMTQSNGTLAQSLAQMSLPNMIAKTVKANSNALSFNGKDAVDFGYELPQEASNVRVEIKDANNKIVRSFETPNTPTASGKNAFVWDGKGADGRVMAPGNYTFTVTAKDARGNDLSVLPMVRGKVTGVRYTGSGAFVIINGAEVPANTVIEVGE